MNNLDQLTVNAIRVLSADAIQKAKSGHPGLPLGAAPTAYELWARHMKINPADAQWLDRDRFILSCGHGSAMLYSLLHLFGFGLTLDDLKQFRQLNSLTPGHPEYHHTVGVDASTGPLGAGLGMAVGMAMAEAHLAEVFNRDNYPVVDHYTFALCGDGCMMEGISSEALSLAGTLGLSKLIIIYDSNSISIEGSTDIAFTEDVQKRVESFGFQTLYVDDGTDMDAIGKAIEEAKADTTRPSFITVRTNIGQGCPAKQGKASAHGEPLGADNIAEMKAAMNWPSDEPFFVPQEVYDHVAAIAEQKKTAYDEWNTLFADYCKAYPELAELWNTYFGKSDFAEKALDSEEFWAYEDKPVATRVLSGNMINRLAETMPNLIGGAADLAPSTKTYMNGKGDFSKDNYAGRNLHFGVREIAMAAIGNGLLLHGGLRSYVSTFFVFSDYVKPMARLSSIMNIPAMYVFTHDSIGVGEDGPTHEPVEQLAMLRSMPNFNVWRPCDATETAAAWYSLIASEGTPGAVVLTRQDLPQQAGSSKDALRGGYVIADSAKETPDAIIVAAGSEVALAVDAKNALAAENIDVRVVSIPCMEIFDQQSAEYKESVLPAAVRARVAVEAGATYGWHKYVGLDGKVIGIDTFGASAPFSVLFPHFGFTAENVAENVKSVLK